MNRLLEELTRVFGDPPVAPVSVIRLTVSAGEGLDKGLEEGDALVDAGCDLVVLDSTSDSPAVRACLAALLYLEPVEVTDRMAADWTDQVVQVRTLVRVAKPHLNDPHALVEQLGDPVLGRLVGLVDRLTARRTPVLIGGGLATAAAVLAVCQMRPEAEQLVLPGSQPQHSAAQRALSDAGLVPLLDLGLDKGSADIALAVVRAGLDQLGA